MVVNGIMVVSLLMHYGEVAFMPALAKAAAQASCCVQTEGAEGNHLLLSSVRSASPAERFVRAIARSFPDRMGSQLFFA
jgi:hypothetical protein